MEGRINRYRYPMVIIGHAVWLYNRFNLSYRDIAEELMYRGIELSHETIRALCIKFGKRFAEVIKKKQRMNGI